ncbi:MAG: hypothetical protein OEP95_01245 [Myxococcales bacterium]|nr:hypothetical protein [Myxococcales bacterium]
MLRGLTLCVVLALSGGCATPRSSHVSQSAMRGAYIDASFATRSGEWRFLFPANGDCAALITPDSPVTYTPGGLWGRFHGPDGTECEPAGVGNLDRRRRSRRQGEVTPSSPARWEVVHRDDEMFLLRGRFELATRVGFAGTHDLVAMVANDDVCRPVAESGASSLVYRPSGTRAFTLGRCPVLAFATPR